MSKHKRLHSITGKGKFAKFAGFVGTHYGLRRPAPKSQTFVNLGKETAPDADIIQGGEGTQHDN